ncbi:hypothetical protein [Actinocorallia libanotica]|uniref:Type VII secretion system (Wss) protein ESAT-6 n=1 Tax=Actinocorallia libanotica TaxID=46162 RepID=A0ABP4C5H2_9ACTN
MAQRPGGGRRPTPPVVPTPTEPPPGELSTLEKALSSTVHVALAVEMLRHAKKLGGRPEKVLEAVDAWHDAAKKIDDAAQNMFSSFNDLGTYWEGPAYGTYKDFMTNNIKIADKDFDALVAAGENIIEMYRHVVQACVDRNQAIAKAAIAIGNNVGYIFGNENNEETLAIRVALENFAIEYSGIKGTLTTTLSNYQASIKSLKGTTLSVSPPGGFPPSVRDRSKWEPT